MKASFFFVFWMCIYRLLALLNNTFINTNAFIIALILVWILSYMINNSIPNVIAYERIKSVYPIMEEIYTGNVKKFARRLTIRTVVGIITALYFIITTVLLVMSFLKNHGDIISLLIFAYFTYSTIRSSVNLSRAYSALHANPTPQQCESIAETTYGLNYGQFYQMHQGRNYEAMFPPRPKGQIAFQIITILFAVAAILFGLYFIVVGIGSFFFNASFSMGTYASMMFLYGSLAVFFGVKDLME